MLHRAARKGGHHAISGYQIIVQPLSNSRKTDAVDDHINDIDQGIPERLPSMDVHIEHEEMDVNITGSSRTGQRLFTDSVVQWLAQSDKRLCRHGYSQSDITLLTPLHHVVKDGDLLLECAKLHLHILGNITTVTLRREFPVWMLMIDDIIPIQAYIPEEVPEGHTPLDVF